MIHLVGFTDSFLHLQVLLLIKKLHLAFKELRKGIVNGTNKPKSMACGRTS